MTAAPDKTWVIAEAGENHCGDMAMAEQLVRVAAEAGADYVKFQLYDAADTAFDDPEREWFHKVALDAGNLVRLRCACEEAGVLPLCTPWDVDKAAVLYDCGYRDMKIASFHIADLELLAFVAQRSERVFVSTGMATWREIDRAAEVLGGVPEPYLLHCVSDYPLAARDVNLRLIDVMRERYPDVAVGYSDHTIGITAAVAAAARGAAVVEKHITLDHDLEGTDHVLSADPGELRAMVAQIRQIEVMLGSGRRSLTVGEAEHRAFLRGRFNHGSRPVDASLRAGGEP